MQKGRSVIPANVQVPAAIVLAALFGVILFWRFAPKTREEPPASSSVALVQDTVPKGSLDDLKRMLDAVGKEPLAPTAWEAAAPLPVPNPFQEPAVTMLAELARERAAPGDLEPEQEEADETPAGPSREDVLAMFTVSGTCVVGGQAMAIVNGRYMRPGDQLNGFTVMEVREREVVIKDDFGVETIGVPAVIWVSDEEGVYDITVKKEEPEP